MPRAAVQLPPARPASVWSRRPSTARAGERDEPSSSRPSVFDRGRHTAQWSSKLQLRSEQLPPAPPGTVWETD